MVVLIQWVSRFFGFELGFAKETVPHVLIGLKAIGFTQSMYTPNKKIDFQTT
jgi:hypothetical protein